MGMFLCQMVINALLLFLDVFSPSNCAKENWLNGIGFHLSLFAFLYSPSQPPVALITNINMFSFSF